MIESGVRSQKSEGVPEKSEIFRGGGVRGQEVAGSGTDSRSAQREEQTAEEVVVSSKEIERVVAKVLDRKLQPIKNILLKMQQEASRPGMTEIIGGIGYILGIMGIVLYFKSRQFRPERFYKKDERQGAEEK